MTRFKASQIHLWHSQERLSADALDFIIQQAPQRGIHHWFNDEQLASLKAQFNCDLSALEQEDLAQRRKP